MGDNLINVECDSVQRFLLDISVISHRMIQKTKYLMCRAQNKKQNPPNPIQSPLTVLRDVWINQSLFL